MSGRHIIPRKVCADANAWAARIRQEAAARAPAVPAGVVLFARAEQPTEHLPATACGEAGPAAQGGKA
jgi:hypothetical protein